MGERKPMLLDKMNKLLLVSALILLFFTAIIFCPLLFIWSTNVLLASIASPLTPYLIPYTLKTWFAAFLILGLVKGSSTSYSR